MKYPNLNEEKRLWKQGYNIVAGIDEAGRGPLAGPVVAAAVVIFNSQFSIYNKFSVKQFSKIKDSKKLSEKQREEAYNFLVNCPHVKWGVGIVSEKVIDKINILEATKLAMQKAVKAFEKNCHSGLDPESRKTAGVRTLDSRFRGNDTKIDFLLIDGNFKINSIVRQKSVVRGDQKVFSIAAASIIAKVTRDRLMQKYHKKYPQYGFDKHKGYGTAAHFASLEKFGPCEIHRRSFYPLNVFSANKKSLQEDPTRM